MAHPAAASFPVRYLALGAVALGAYAVADAERSSPTSSKIDRGEPSRASTRGRVSSQPRVALEPSVVDEAGFDDDDDTLRGHDLLDDPAEFEFVFEVDGVSYLRLSTDERATSRGEPRLIDDEDGSAVVAAVETAALPADLRGWAGREVWVDGTCRARVVGFAEVSRVIGEPPGSYDEDDAYREEPWTVASVTASNVTLAARLDGCSGTWARATSYPAAAATAKVDAPGLEAAARRDLLAPAADDERQLTWTEQGGEGDWRDAAEVVSSVYQHELTAERWVIVQARHGGSCGDPSVDLMAVYRANEDGSVRRVADLDDAFSDVLEVVDLDGDGQPELILGGSNDATRLIDLTGQHLTSISVPSHFHTCGC